MSLNIAKAWSRCGPWPARGATGPSRPWSATRRSRTPWDARAT